MMDVDQPVSSTTGDEKTEREADSSHGNATDKASELIVRENDDLPALLISDSEEDEPSKAPCEENKNVDISGISPIEATVANVNDKSDVTINETILQPTAETSALSVADDEEISVVENIDLTGASSTEDFAVNDSASERTALSVAKAPTQTKPSSEMTAQELLESLLEAQEEAFASQRAEETLQSKNTDKTVNVSEVGLITKSLNDSTPGEIAKDTTNRDSDEQLEEDSSKMETLVVDDECLLEEIVNAPERQQEMEIDEQHTGANSSLCSDDGSGANHITEGAETASSSKSNDNDDIVRLSEKDDETVECSEPPKKRARSMAPDPDPELKVGTSESTFHGMENNTAQNEKPSEEVASNTEDLTDRTERLDLHSELKTNLSAVETELASNTLADKSQTVIPGGSSDKTNDSTDLVNGDQQKQQCIAGSGEKSVEKIQPAVCSEVLVIDDDEDEDEAEVTSNKVQDTDDKKIDTKEDTSDVADASSQLSPALKEKLEPKPMAMEFLRRFNKPIAMMTRSDLEKLVLQKLSEAIVHQSENAELRRIVKRQSAKLQGYERTLADMTSHYDGLKLVAERAVEDMKKRAKSYIAPVKITRAVGIQVSRPAMEEMATSYISSNISKIMPENRMPLHSASPAIVTTNGAVENRAKTKSASPGLVNKANQQNATFCSGPQNLPVNMNRSQFSNNVSSTMTTARITQNGGSMANGMLRPNSQAARHNNNHSTTNVSLVPGSAIKLTPAHANDGSGASVANTAKFASASPNNDSAANSIPGGKESLVRKKFHKFTPKRPPLSPYQQAQQEKQARQQQELLVQQIHEQSQQAQRKAQINVRSDLPAIENSPARLTMDAAARQRSLTSQGRLLNANLQKPVSQGYQVVSFGAATPTTSAMTNSTTIQLSEPKPNSQPKTTVASSANDSLIDLTDEDDTTGRESGDVSSSQVKRMKLSQSGPFTATPTIPASIPNVSNQFVRLQPKMNTTNGSPVSPAGTTSAGGVNQLNNATVRAPLNVNRTTNANQSLRHPVYNGNTSRLPAASTDTLRKRVVLAPLPHPGPQPSDPTWKLSPPQPSICVNNVQAGIVISWTMPSLTDLHAVIETYQIYAYQQLSNPTPQEEWRHVGDVKALLLPMAVTLTQFHEGQRYYFAVRAIDIHKRIGKFCEPRTWNDSNLSNN